MSKPDLHDLDKKLASNPLRKKGFTDRLQQKIEQNIAAKQKSRRWFTPFLALGGGTAAIAVMLLLPWGTAHTLSSSSSVQAPGEEVQTESAAFIPSPPTISSALLIGLRTEHESKDESRKLSTTHYSSYRTMLVAPVKGELQKTSEGSGILMPYKQSFWKIDALSYKTATDEYRYLSAHPAEQEAKQETLPEIEGADTQHVETLLFAGNQYLSIATSKQDLRGNAINQFEKTWVRTLPQLKDKKTFTLSISDQAENGYISLPGLFGKGIGSVLDDLSGKRQMTGMPSEINGHNWTIARTPGRWVGKAAETYKVPDNRNESYILHDFPRALPEKVTSYDTICCAWQDIKAQWPQATDALTSPTNDLLVIFEEGKLLFYPYGQSRSASPLLTIDLQPGEQLVMAQWATDHYVQDWITKVGSLLKQ